MTDSDISHFGAVEFISVRDNSLDQVNRIVAATLFDYGHHIERQSAISPTRARIQAERCRIEINLTSMRPPSDIEDKINPEDMGYYRQVSMRIVPSLNDQGDKDHAQLLLVVMIYRLVEALEAQRVRWLDETMVLSVRQFLGAFADVTPPKLSGTAENPTNKSAQFADIDETEAKLNRQYAAIRQRGREGVSQGMIQVDHEKALMNTFRHDPIWAQAVATVEAEKETASPAQRLTVWAMTGVLIFVSAPVAAAMAAVNLIRGEDLRLNTHVMSYTACISVADQTQFFATMARSLGI